MVSERQGDGENVRDVKDSILQASTGVLANGGEGKAREWHLGRMLQDSRQCLLQSQEHQDELVT